MSTLYYLLSELLSEVGREINEALENLKLEAIISFLHDKGGNRMLGLWQIKCVHTLILYLVGPFTF